MEPLVSDVDQQQVAVLNARLHGLANCGLDEKLVRLDPQNRADPIAAKGDKLGGMRRVLHLASSRGCFGTLWQDDKVFALHSVIEGDGCATNARSGGGALNAWLWPIAVRKPTNRHTCSLRQPY